MNIVFYGASVTQQKHDSGYVPTFQKLLIENNKNYDVTQNGFGSMHLYDAGICKIDEIISLNPSFCFIDWFSTGFITTDKKLLFKYLDTIVRKLMLINSQICFLLFDRLTMCNNRLKMYEIIIEYAKLYYLPYIELYNNTNVSELLRDEVHTNELGAQFYSSKIYEYFITNIENKNTIYEKIPEENTYCNIKCLQINTKVVNEISINGNFNIIGILQQIGNFSGIIEINRNKLEIYKVTIWDQWCHFTRDNIKINIPWSECVKIKILQDTFDTQACKSNIDFNTFEKYMYIYEIYYLGDLCIDYIN